MELNVWPWSFNFAKALNATEWYALEWFILGCADFTLIFLKSGGGRERQRTLSTEESGWPPLHTSLRLCNQIGAMGLQKQLHRTEEERGQRLQRLGEVDSYHTRSLLASTPHSSGSSQAAHPAKEAGHRSVVCPTPPALRKGPGARPGLPNQNKAKLVALGPEGQATTSLDLAHTRALLPHGQPLAVSGWSHTEPPFIPWCSPAAKSAPWGRKNSRRPHPPSIWVL